MYRRSAILFLVLTILTILPIRATGNVILTIDGEPVVYTQRTGTPFIDANNRTQVPFRATMDAIGAEVSWDSRSRTATTIYGDTRIDVPIDRAYILVNNRKVQNDTVAVIVDGRTFLPIRIVLESLGYQVSWNADNQTVVVTTSKPTASDAVQSRSAQLTFGIRHDKNLSEYETLAATSSANRPDFSPVAAIVYSLDGSDNRDYIATGTLIAPQWVLSAGHNFYISEEQTAPADVAGVRINFGNDPNKPTATYAVEQIIYHPTWLEYNDGFYYGNDYSLIKLSEPVTDIAPATLMRSSDEPLGSVVWYAGFGDYSMRPGQNEYLYSPRHALENVLDRKTDGVVSFRDGTSYTGGYLAFDFDDPTGQSNTLGDGYIGIDERELGRGTSDSQPRPFEGATVEGDSGGPLFVYHQGKWRVAGVLSGGADKPTLNHVDSSYGDISIFMRVSTQIEWIERVIKD